MNIRVISAAENLVEETGKLLLSGGPLAENLAVFPGKRPAHFLRKYLADRQGRAFKAPVVTSMDGFIDLAAAELGLKGREAPPLDLAAVLYARLKPELCRVIGRDPADLTLDSFLPWALKLAGDFEELKIELKTPRDLAAYDSLLPRDLRSASVIKKLESFSALYGRFYAELEREGLLTRSMKYAGVAREIGRFGHEKYGHMVFAGFFALTAAERTVLKHLAARGAQVLLGPGPGLEEQFSFLGGAVQPAPGPAPKLNFYRAPDTHGEIFKLAEVLQKPAPGDVVVLPEPAALFPLVEHVLPAAGDYNISMGYPLAATPVYALLDALGDLLDKRGEAGYFAPDYLKFVFHPYVKNLYLDGAAEPGRVIFQTLEEDLSRRVNKYVTLREIEENAELHQRAAARLKDYGGAISPAAVKAHLKGVHDALVRPFEQLATIADFADKLLAVVDHVSRHSTAPLHPYWAPFVEKTLEHIIGLRNCRLAGERFGAAAGYFKFFKTSLQGAAYPFAGTPLKGLQVLGLLETRGLKFDRVFFLDANADVLPAARKEDSVLSHFVRESLGLATYKTRERLARYYFSALAAGAKEAHIFYKDSADKERSPFVEKLIWDLERRGGGQGGGEVHLRVDFSQTEPSPAAKTPELTAALMARQFSPSAIDTYLACGLRFYYRYGLRLAEKDEVGDEIDQRDIGNIVHEVLEGFFKERAGRPLNVMEKDRGEVLAAARKVFDVKLKGHGSGFEYLIKRQVERRLGEILDYHRDNLVGVTVLACETELKAELPTRFGKVKLRGFADRIDQRGGTVHILDYKTGANASVPNWQRFDLGLREEWPGTLKSVQLPFYILAYMAEHGIESAAGMDASLMLLGSENITEETLYKERNRKTPDKAAIFGTYRQAITALLEEILDPALPFSPTADEKNCASCPFKTLCGRQWA
ncbi:MAG: PD-(D/E)XK nuclease family protein [Elusimicrobiales bacterium]|nr:PD-(D/E)XK nuclease family protein [Elusimicrobiales bacterium]